MRGIRIFLGCVVLFGAAALNAQAKEIILKNGDRISGEVIAQTAKTITLDTAAMGKVTIQKAYVRPAVKTAAAAAPVAKKLKEITYKHEISVGYNQTGGNTETRQSSLGFKVDRKTRHDEWSAKGTAFYSSTNRKMDGQKLDGFLRYAYSFGPRLKWYHFFKMAADHDKFANVNYRLVPSTGVGYWFSDKLPLKAMAEIGLGYEHTDYSGGTKNTDDPVLIPLAFVEKRISKKVLLSQELIYYPSLKDTADYRLHSETALINPITSKLNLKFSVMDDYNAAPAEGAKKNDYRLITSLDYAF